MGIIKIFKKIKINKNYGSSINTFWFFITGDQSQKDPPTYSSGPILKGDIRITNDHLKWFFKESEKKYGTIRWDLVMMTMQWLNYHLIKNPNAFEELKHQFKISEDTNKLRKEITTA